MMIGLLCKSHLSEMLTVRAHRQHHTALRLYGVICTVCVTPLRGDDWKGLANNR